MYLPVFIKGKAIPHRGRYPRILFIWWSMRWWLRWYWAVWTTSFSSSKFCCILNTTRRQFDPHGHRSNDLLSKVDHLSLGILTVISTLNNKRKKTFFILNVKKSLKIPKGQSESVYRRRTDNTMAKRKSNSFFKLAPSFHICFNTFHNCINSLQSCKWRCSIMHHI